MRRPTWSVFIKRNPISVLMMGLCLLIIFLLAAVALAAPVKAGGPTEEEYHLAAINYAAEEQAGFAARHGYAVAQLKIDAERVGRCENGLRAYSSNRYYYTSWQHGTSYWSGRLSDYERWLRQHNANNPNQQLAMPQHESTPHLDPLTGARVTIWWMLHRHGGTWRGTSGWPHCSRYASR